MKRIVLLSIALVLASSAASAKLGVNGVSLNKLGANGVSLNGDSASETALAVQAVTLVNGTRLTVVPGR